MYLVKRGNKYGAKSTEYDGIIYHSKKEAGFAQTLDNLKLAKNASERVVEWERQVKIPLKVYGRLIANYYVDFKVKYADGHEAFIEVKGIQMDVWKMKWKILEAIAEKEYPGIDLVVIS